MERLQNLGYISLPNVISLTLLHVSLSHSLLSLHLYVTLSLSLFLCLQSTRVMQYFYFTAGKASHKSQGKRIHEKYAAKESCRGAKECYCLSQGAPISLRLSPDDCKSGINVTKCYTTRILTQHTIQLIIFQPHITSKY